MFIPVGRLFLQFSSVQLLSHVRSLWPHGLQHTRPACPSQTPRVYSNLCHWVGEGDGTPLQYSCLENPMDGGAWWAAVHGITRSRTRLSDFTFTFHFHAWEKEMATHSSVLAWRIPGKGEPGGLPSMGSHRVGHDWSDLAAAACHWVRDAIQPSHPLSSPSPPAPNPSQHQSLFQWVNSLHEVAKVLEFQL